MIGIVTGGSRGIGAAICTLAADRGQSAEANSDRRGWLSPHTRSVPS
jgi:NAD(P)-dependent dehydrogenase (short-subunit alcohol dehydrogenase family)